jgi:hypothetical protein
MGEHLLRGTRRVRSRGRSPVSVYGTRNGVCSRRSPFSRLHIWRSGRRWSPALTPSLGFLLACKPTIGAALFAGYPTRRAFITASVFALTSVVIYPSWPWYWFEGLRHTAHMTAPVTHLTAGGPLLLLALLKWRRPEARILAALSCVPHTTLLYETVPLFLIVRRWYEGVVLVLLTVVVEFLPADRSQYDPWIWATGHQHHLLLVPAMSPHGVTAAQYRRGSAGRGFVRRDNYLLTRGRRAPRIDGPRALAVE